MTHVIASLDYSVCNYSVFQVGRKSKSKYLLVSAHGKLGMPTLISSSKPGSLKDPGKNSFLDLV